MPSAGKSLQAAVHARLCADAALTGLLGGPRVFDDAPRDGIFPYLTFGQSTERDWSTGSEEGKEHILTLHVWSRVKGRRETQELLEAARAALHEAPLALAGHRLVNLRHELTETRRDADGEIYHGIMRLRAVTEPAP